MRKILLLLLLIFSMVLPISDASADLNAAISGVQVDLMTQSPSPARPGETVELTFSVQNVGNQDLSNVVVSIDPQYPFSQVEGESLSQKISFLEARQDTADATLLKFKLKVDPDVSEGTYDLDVLVTDSESSSSVSTKVSIDIKGKEYAQIVTISESNIDVATVEPLEFVITNTGTSPLKNMAVSWDESTGVILPVYSSNTKYISYLGVNQSVSVSYSVMADVNANPGLYQLDITLKFEDYNSNSTTINTKAGLFVGGTTDFDLSYSESSAGEVSLSLANVGNNEAYSVKVSIPDQQNFQATGSTSTIVGNLEKGDYTITSFSISQTGSMSANSSSSQMGSSGPSGMPGGNVTESQYAQSSMSQNDLLVLIEYTDSAGQRRSVEKTVQIEGLSGGSMTASSYSGAGPSSRSSSSTTTYLEYGLLVVVVVGGAYYYRKKKMMKEGTYEPLGVQLRELKNKILKKDNQ
jgi:hypothetical protein